MTWAPTTAASGMLPGVAEAWERDWEEVARAQAAFRAALHPSRRNRPGIWSTMERLRWEQYSEECC